ncbi:F-box/kelch-repeat protein At3g23880-like [Rhododendron vialii]|uniref:F-box/kelch-repeat protein At3g23880-like n=1 Tax=Rhododendron vialii TaxID=182163 RepID=UPI00265E91AA|nr:F-box/kelch-repeat protein At3g23880-like [Rhododendron vialii]XP_058203811.1 F-box/kelch-repeat protein At3g23880-like [Rhododendron vialii]
MGFQMQLSQKLVAPNSCTILPKPSNAIRAPSMATESSKTRPEPKKTKQTPQSQSPLPTEDSHLLPNLPFEIIVEILSRLSVKSLLRFRCVSKSWRSLISQTEFAKTHLRLASVNTDYTHHRLILQGPCSYVDFKSCSLYSVLNEKSDTAVELDCPLKRTYSPVMVVGSCNGLVCIAADLEVIISNPSARKSKRLPNAETKSYNFLRYGFGYDESVDDYKVARFFWDIHREVEVMVYSLRTDSWRQIRGFPQFFPLDHFGTYLNGALHWTRFTKPNVIICLDLANETFGEVLEPDYRDGYSSRSLLNALNGCLCILCSYDYYSDIWVMKEYGIRESWTKLVVIPYVTHPSSGTPSSKPFYILKNGEVLLNVYYTHLVRYNPKDGTSIYHVIHNCSESFVVYHYIENLVSPYIDADNGVQRQHHY